MCTGRPVVGLLSRRPVENVTRVQVLAGVGWVPWWRGSGPIAGVARQLGIVGLFVVLLVQQVIHVVPLCSRCAPARGAWVGREMGLLGRRKVVVGAKSLFAVGVVTGVVVHGGRARCSRSAATTAAGLATAKDIAQQERPLLPELVLGDKDHGDDRAQKGQEHLGSGEPRDRG